MYGVHYLCFKQVNIGNLSYLLIFLYISVHLLDAKIISSILAKFHMIFMLCVILKSACSEEVVINFPFEI